MITAHNISKVYNNGKVEALKDVSLTINDGEFVVILGASGSGKSTLMNVLSSLQKATELGKNTDYNEIIQALGLSDKLNKRPAELSGGEQQRVCIARALAKKPSVLFLDEPTGALDEKTGREVLDCIMKQKEILGFTMVMVTHNQNVAEMAQTVIKMNSGKIVETYANAQQKTAYEIGW